MERIIEPLLQQQVAYTEALSMHIAKPRLKQSDVEGIHFIVWSAVQHIVSAPLGSKALLSCHCTIALMVTAEALLYLVVLRHHRLT